MNEITKLYENAGIKKQYCGWLDMGDLDTNMQYVRCETKEEYDNYAALDSSDLVQTTPNEEYPPFTAEKQLEIVKFLLKKAVYYDVKDDKYWFYYEECESVGYKPFDEAIVHFINKLWKDLTPEEKQQVKGILE